MIKHTRQQRIAYLQSLDERSPEEETVLQKLLAKLPMPESVAYYQKKKIAQYYQLKAIKSKQNSNNKPRHTY